MAKDVLSGAKLFEKVYHRGDKVRADGAVSALCFKRPRPIDLSKAMWTNRDEAVTCPKCLRAIKARIRQLGAGSKGDDRG